jgi:YgiT-type zinc finger domain-containing protein
MNAIICDVCGKKGARVRQVTRTYGKGKSEFLIRLVPVVSCPNCGESYLTAETLRNIESIKRHRQKLAVKRSIPVAQFVAST